jgi:hypothetical protein
MPNHIRWHFPDLSTLLESELPLEIALAYTFLKLEQAWNRALYGGLVRVHKADATFARRILDMQHLTRDGFQVLFRNVFGKEPAGQKDIERAEKIRDRVIHGKKVEAASLREAIGDALDYSHALHDQIFNLAGFTPFGDMRGFATKVTTLDRSTTKWVLKGMGFAVKR